MGLDAASGLIHMGKTISLIEAADHLLPKQLDKRSSQVYEREFEKRGITLYLNRMIHRVVTDEYGAVRELELSGGERILCDLLVVTSGVRSNIRFLEGSGIETDEYGLIIDESGRTNVEDVFGAGDVTGRSPIWPAAVKQGMVAAANMCGKHAKMDDFFASKSTMNFLGIPAMSLGIPDKPDDSYEEVVQDKGDLYQKIIYRDGRIYGAVIQGDLSYGGILTQLIANRIDVSKVKKPLFQIDYSDFFHISQNFEFYYE